MKRIAAALAVLCLVFLTGCPGVGNVKKGHVPPGKIK